MTLRVIQERKKDILVENDLRGLGSIVKERPPCYAMHIKAKSEKLPLIQQLVSQRQMRLRQLQGDGWLISTPEDIPHPQQAVWHFLMVAELIQHNLIQSLRVSLEQPIASLLLAEKSSVRPSPMGETDVVWLDASIPLFILQAGYWKSRFHEAELIRLLEAGESAYVKLDATSVHELMVELNPGTSKQQNKAG